MPQPPYFATLPARGLITISGPDSKPFLQGLITNNIETLPPGKILYACLLTPQGKFLHDMFIQTIANETILIDCEGGERAQDLYNRFMRYRLRQNIEVSCNDNHTVYAIIGSANHGLIDPRHTDMGSRSFEKPENMEEIDFETWDRLRISLCIPDGSRDLIPEKSTLAEANMDNLNAIDYKKGCYIGQELTARMHYRGLAKKQLKTIDPRQHPNAQIRSAYNDIALALMTI